MTWLFSFDILERMKKLLLLMTFIFGPMNVSAETFRLLPNFHYLNYGRLRSQYECLFDLAKSIDFAKPVSGAFLEKLELVDSPIQGSPLRQIELRGQSSTVSILVKFEASEKTRDLLVKRWTQPPLSRIFSITEDLDCASSGGSGYSRVRAYEVTTSEPKSSF